MKCYQMRATEWTNMRVVYSTALWANMAVSFSWKMKPQADSFAKNIAALRKSNWDIEKIEFDGLLDDLSHFDDFLLGVLSI
jgi:hypothetical protein